MTARKLQLPKIPESIVQEIYNSARTKKNLVEKIDSYKWVAASDAIQQWCKENICTDMYWGVQIISNNLPVHKDIVTEIKLNYIIDSAGANVITKFYDDDMNLIQTVEFEENEWYILDVSKYHEVVGVNQDQSRISVTGRIFPI
jgi:hypothetical protein